MAGISDIYGSGKFIRTNQDGCLDIDGKPYEFTGTISKTSVHTFPPEKGETEGKKQIVVAFAKLPDMELGLNVTNARAIAKITGTEDFEEWPGATVEMFVVPEEKSKTGHAVRIRKPRNAPAAAPQIPAGPTFGGIAAARLTKRLTDEKRDLGKLRAHLKGKYPNYAKAIESDVQNWPADMGGDVGRWFASPEPSPIGGGGMTDEDIPFSHGAFDI